MGHSSISRRHQQLGRPGASAGFTFLEMLILFIIVGIVVAITGRSVRGSFTASSRRSASREVASYMHRARAIAIQQSRNAFLVRVGNVLKVLVDSSGTKVLLGTTIDLSQRYGATLTATPKDTAYFDPRGFVPVAATTKFIVTLSGKADTLCVTGLGRVTTRSCP